ncbi:MAG: hypothetical protein ACTS43_02135 [Candidatus Hodgkinia cicadicola]
MSAVSKLIALAIWYILTTVVAQNGMKAKFLTKAVPASNVVCGGHRNLMRNRSTGGVKRYSVQSASVDAAAGPQHI